MVEMLVVAAVVLVLVVLNGLFVAAEFAIIATPRSAAVAAAQAGGAAARRVRDIVADPRRQDRYIATAQVGITVASLGLGMYGEHALAEWLEPRLHALGEAALVGAHALASVVAIALLTYLHIVVGEMIPKALALQHAHQTAVAVSLPMLWAKRLAFPLVIALNATGNGVLRLVGVRRELTAGQYHSAAELQLVVEESQKGGLLRDEEARLVREGLAFSDLTAGEVMMPRVSVVGIPLGASAAQVRDIVKGHPHTRYPVYSGSLDHIVGSVHVRNLLKASLADRPLEPSDLRSIPFVPHTTPLEDVLDTLRLKQAHVAVVMDEFGGTAGILTAEDIMEEVAGDIQETAYSSAERPDAEPRRLVVPGTLRLDELSDRLGRSVGHDVVDSVSGLILDRLARPAVPGDVVEHDGLRFEVTSVAGRGVRSCVVTPLAKPEREKGRKS